MKCVFISLCVGWEGERMPGLGWTQYMVYFCSSKQPGAAGAVCSIQQIVLLMWINIQSVLFIFYVLFSVTLSLKLLLTCSGCASALWSGEFPYFFYTYFPAGDGEKQCFTAHLWLCGCVCCFSWSDLIWSIITHQLLLERLFWLFVKSFTNRDTHRGIELLGWLWWSVCIWFSLETFCL